MPLAPGLLSTITGCLTFSARRWPTCRATGSVTPPGGNGTMIVIGLAGKVWPRANAETAAVAAPAMRCRTALRVNMDSSFTV